MKLHIPISVAALLAVCLVASCVKPTILSVSQTALSFDSSGGSQVVVLTANKLWTASSNQSWLRVSPSSGEGEANISISCTPNDTYDNRTGTIKIVSEELSQTISVTQSEAKGLTVSQTEYNLSNAAQTISVEIKTNDQYTIDIDASCRDWINRNSTKGLSSNIVNFDISKNETYSERSGKITIKQASGSMMSTVVVTQSQTNGLFADKTSYQLSYEKQQLNIKVKSNVKYEVNIDDACKQWISYLGTKSLTESTVSLSIAENEGAQREGKIILNYGNLQETVVIKQESGIVNIEDKNFKAYCVENFDKNGDRELSYRELNDVQEVDVRSGNIASMQGIEYMPKLTKLSCSDNKLKKLDISKNTALLYLYCTKNQLTGLDLSKNTSLLVLECRFNQMSSLDVSNNKSLFNFVCEGNKLTSLDVSNNTQLSWLDCGSNQLSAIDVSKNKALKWLFCSYNQLKNLDIRNNTKITWLQCDGNQLTNLDLSQNTTLTRLRCAENQITSLDLSNNLALSEEFACYDNRLTSINVSKNTSLTHLNCRNNQLTSLDVSNNTLLKYLGCEKNRLTSLDVSNCLKLTDLYCTDNPSLTQIWLKKDQSISNFNYDKNIAKIYFVDGTIPFKDAKFKAHCVSNFDTDGDGEVSFIEAQKVKSIYIRTNDITTLEGVEFFENLEILECSVDYGYCRTIDGVTHYYKNEQEVRGKLKSLNISSNPFLQRLDCEGQQLTSLDISRNTALTDLDCRSNQLTSLDVSKNMALTFLECDCNQLTSIDISNCTALTVFWCIGNQLTNLDVSKNTVLTGLHCSSNRLTSLNISKNTALTRLWCDSNQLTSLDVSRNTSLTELACQDNQLTSLDVSNNLALKELFCYSNQLTSLDVSRNTALTKLDCRWNPDLSVIWLHNNQTISDFQYEQNVSTLYYVDGDIIHVTAVSLNQKSISIKKGETYSLTATVKPSNATNKSVSWKSSSTSVATVSANGMITAVSPGTATITATTVDGNYTASCTVTVTNNTSGTENGHDYVDLGLPSGLRWATCNIGASSPEGYGNYYAWGETTTKSDYSWSSYKWCNGNYYTITKYNGNSSLGLVDNKTVLELSDDAARQNWGGRWRMPTQSECQELKDNCIWTWGTQGGKSGFIVTSKTNGNSIFLPNAGYRDVGNLYEVGSWGLYWTSSLYPDLDASDIALVLALNVGSLYNHRCDGQSVRPVFKERESVSSVRLDKTQLSLTSGQSAQLTATVSPESATNKNVSWKSSSTSVATVSANGLVSAVSPGTATITVTTVDGNYSANCSVTVTNNISGTENGHDYVDLGLPSGVKWATCNVGASSPEQYGNYYAWGEISTKSEYSYSTYKWGFGPGELSKYGQSGLTILELMDDAARVNWGGRWRMPTKAECEELLNNCTKTWTTQNGVDGLLLTSKKNGNTIFLPNAGYQVESSLYSLSTFASYWSSSLNPDDQLQAYFIFGAYDNGPNVGLYYRYVGRSVGRSVRPIFKEQEQSGDGHEYIDLGLSVKWATCNIGAYSPEENGYFFAWGETSPKSDYSWSTYKWCNGNYKALTKYNTDSFFGWVDNKTCLELSDDAAHAYWGGQWRMPTLSEWRELLDNCTSTWTTQNGVEGRLFTSKKNGNSIFLPYSHSGHYWSSSLCTARPCSAYYVYFGSSGVSWDSDYGDRHNGYSVRPVIEK